MANKRSDLMANLLATPPVLSNIKKSHGRIRSKVAVITLDNTEAAGVLFPICRLGAQDVILDIQMVATALGAGATDNNIGLWTAVDWTAGDGVAKDADIYMDGETFAAAFTSWTDATNAGAGARTPAQYGRFVWQDAGDAAAPAAGTQYDLVLQCVTDPGAAGTVVIRVDYLAGD